MRKGGDYSNDRQVTGSLARKTPCPTRVIAMRNRNSANPAHCVDVSHCPPASSECAYPGFNPLPYPTTPAPRTCQAAPDPVPSRPVQPVPSRPSSPGEAEEKWALPIQYVCSGQVNTVARAPACRHRPLCVCAMQFSRNPIGPTPPLNLSNRCSRAQPIMEYPSLGVLTLPMCFIGSIKLEKCSRILAFSNCPPP